MIEVPETNLQSEPQGSYLDLSTTADDMVELCLEYKDHPEGSLASNIGMPVQTLSSHDAFGMESRRG